jgi:predicted nucleic acid-binding protein
MRLVVDANILIGNLLRVSGRRLLAEPVFDAIMTQDAWEEAQVELPRRVARFARARGITTEAAALAARVLADAEDAVRIVPRETYAPLEETARRRCDRDPGDWPTLALALLVDAAIWSEDDDLAGCGVATWRTAVLAREIAAGGLEATGGRPIDAGSV